MRVGDELVNINGSALYGSRQEALILIKGSYRVLKIVVRRYRHAYTCTVYEQRKERLKQFK